MPCENRLWQVCKLPGQKEIWWAWQKEKSLRIEKVCTGVKHKSKVTMAPKADGAASVFLLKYGRKRLSIIGDGNCLFRCLSSVFFGVQDRHFEVRKFLVSFIKQNPSDFTSYCLPLTVQDHTNRMAKEFIWGTHVEIFAASLFLNTPIFVAVCKADHQTYIIGQNTNVNYLQGLTVATLFCPITSS